MRILKLTVLFIVVALMLMAFLGGCADSPSLTVAEQEVIEALLQQQDGASRSSEKQVCFLL